MIERRRYSPLRFVQRSLEIQDFGYIAAKVQNIAEFYLLMLAASNRVANRFANPGQRSEDQNIILHHYSLVPMPNLTRRVQRLIGTTQTTYRDHG